MESGLLVTHTHSLNLRTIARGATPNGLESGAPNALSNMSWLFATGAAEKAESRRPGFRPGAATGAGLATSGQVKRGQGVESVENLTK